MNDAIKEVSGKAPSREQLDAAMTIREKMILPSKLSKHGIKQSTVDELLKMGIVELDARDGFYVLTKATWDMIKK